jgi:hypothetical protein
MCPRGAGGLLNYHDGELLTKLAVKALETGQLEHRVVALLL